MKLLFIFSLFILISRTLAGCITISDPQNPKDRQLGIFTASTPFVAQSDARIYARIYYGSSLYRGQWSNWRFLDNTGCDDYKLGAIDYFDDFDSINYRWYAISLFSCGTSTDGLLVEGIYYWNGYSNSYISAFCENIASPWGECGDGSPMTGKCGYFSSVNAYTRMWIDADDFFGCNGITFKTGSIALPFTIAHPGKPDCFGEVGR